MNRTSKKIFVTASLAAAILLFSAGGIHSMRFTQAFAAGAEASDSQSYYSEESVENGGSQEGGGSQEPVSSQEPVNSQEQGGKSDTSSVTSDDKPKQNVDELIKQYTARSKAALDELESHAKAMIKAANAGDRKKYDSELKAYEQADIKVGEVINDTDGIPYDDASPYVDKAYERLESIDKLRQQAEAALANSLGGAMDEDGNLYSISQVSVKVNSLGKSFESYDSFLQGLGPAYKDDENHLIYRISLYVGKKPVKLIGGLTKSITIGIPAEKIGKSPVTSFYICDEGDGNAGAPIGEKRGYFNKATWCLTVKVSKSVTYYVVCGKPGTKKGTYRNDTFPDDVVAVRGDNQNLTANELREMLSAVLLEDGHMMKAKALEAVEHANKAAAVYEIVLPEDVTLAADAEIVADIVCPQAADKAVEVYRYEDESEPEWVGTFLADSNGKLQILTEQLGVFVLCWDDGPDRNDPAVVSPTDEEDGNSDLNVFLVILGVVAAIAIICEGTYLAFRHFKK